LGKEWQNEDMNREEQFAIIKKAEDIVLEWSKIEGIGLFRVEFIVPFVDDDFSLHTWFFFNKNLEVTENKQNGTSDRLTKHFLEILQSLG
jgi:hypothetical protein